MKEDVKRRVGRRLRSRRLQQGLTVRSLADRSQVSSRYITSAEHGQANVSLEKLERLCTALDIPIARMVTDGHRGELDALLAERTDTEIVEIVSWLRDTYGTAYKPMVALLGVRGAGKTAVGQQLSSCIGRPFIELDQKIETLADLSLAEIFSVHGEGYYRRLEYEALNQVIDSGIESVVATGGGIVTDAKNYARLRQTAITVWLKARPEDHWDRVIQQGDRRPMRDHPQAMAELRDLLEHRQELYGKANLIVDTSAHSIKQVVEKIKRFLVV